MPFTQNSRVTLVNVTQALQPMQQLRIVIGNRMSCRTALQVQLLQVTPVPVGSKNLSQVKMASELEMAAMMRDPADNPAENCSSFLVQLLFNSTLRV